MEIYVYSPTMTRLGIIEKFESLIWTRRYGEAGEFKLRVPKTDNYASLLVKKNIIMKRGGNEAAEIRYVHINTNPEGYEQIEVQGKFVLSWIGKRIIKKQVIATADPQTLIYRIANENVASPVDTNRAITSFTVATTDAEVGADNIDYTSEFGANALVEIVALAKAAKLGIRVDTDETTATHTFHVYKGIDRTSENTSQNAPCVFSRDFENVSEQEYTNSVENFKTTAYVGGEIVEGGERQVAETGGSFIGLDRDEVFIAATDVKQTYKDDDETEVTLTDAEYLAVLSARGSTELEGYTETLSFASKINQTSNLIYKTDYDLGDLVTCIEKSWGVAVNVRITEIVETYQSNVFDVDVTFGEGTPALISGIRQIIKQRSE